MDDVVVNKGIVPCLKGGLGNQLFILTAGFIASKYLNCPLYIFQKNIYDNKHNKYKIDYNDAVFKYFGIHLPYILNNNLINFLCCNNYSIHNNNDSICFEPWTLQSCHPGLLMMQYYQYYPQIQLYEHEIRELILKSIKEYTMDSLQISNNRVFLHIRRGDFLEFSNIHYLQPIDYYKSALDKLNKLNPQINEIIIVSDDINWIFSQEFFTSIPNAKVYTNDNEVQTLYMMTTCHGGAICANSTFSWWGAFLGAHSERSPVIVPEKWINQKVFDLFPKEWIVI